MTTAVFAFCMVSATILTLARVVPLRMILGYATWVDVGFSVGMLGFFSGTLTGAMSAVVAGLLLAVTLTIGRKLLGYQRLAFDGDGWRSGHGWARGVIVVDYPPIWLTWKEPVREFLKKLVPGNGPR